MEQVLSKRTILIVEDQEVELQILTSLLEDEYDLLAAHDGREALEVLEQNSDSVVAVLLDIIMPVMDGYEVLTRIRQNETLTSIPVLVTSQEGGAEFELKALGLGASDFIPKPYNPQILRHRLSNAIQIYESGKKIDALQRDVITGLFTKVAFAEHAQEVLRTQTDIEWNMIALDIDRFKLVNESYGQHVGDELLAYFAKLLIHFSETKNCVCARSYADHFFILAERRDYNYIRTRYTQMAEHLQKFPLDMKISLKMGVYQIHDRSIEVDSMCDRALIAINQVKGQYAQEISFYDDSLRKQLLLEQWITDEMEHALKEQQFQVYFQPKYDTFSESLSGAEALVRWIHPQKGFMSPAEFIPVFESNGFITELDMYVWDKTCEYIRDWMDEYDCYVPISVNVSRKDIYKPNLPQILVDTVHRHGLEPRHLHLEITESAYVENPDQMLKTVEDIKAAGFTIEMDDFGSGYSSLNMLASMPIDILKLDMKFVQNYSEKDSSRGIMSFVIGLAKWMNLYVIAEGVETAEQLELLRGMDCNLAQGYYFSKPLPAAEFAEVLRASGKNLSIMNDQAVRVTGSQENEFQTMLVVDGLAVNRAILTEYFKNSYSVVEASGGKAALQYLKHVKRADIVVMDAHLPDMEAVELIREMKKDPLMDRIPLIVTLHGSENTMNRLLNAGADAYVTKPFTKEQMLDCLSRVMSAQSERMKQQEEQILDKIRMMEMLSTKDYLTGLWNRLEMERRIEEHIKHAADQQFFFVLADIDGYKEIVNEYGYSAADRVLHEVAERLGGCFGETDVVGRISGDRFGILMNVNGDEDELLVCMTHLQSELTFEDNGISVSCSCGVSMFPDSGEDFDTLYFAAERALESAKEKGRNRYEICAKAADAQG